MLHGAYLALAVCAVAAWAYATHQYLAYFRAFERHRLMGGIPQHLKRKRMALGWMIASKGIIPGGDIYRQRCMLALVAFGVCLLGMLVVGQFA
jgi:hypothetical protein